MAVKLSGAEMRRIREELERSPAEFATALGYTGSHKVRDTQIRRLELGLDGRQVPSAIARLTLMFETFGIPWNFEK